MNPPLVDHCLELLAPLGAVRSRRMFGGHGLYVDDLFVALIAFERLYLKADAQTQPAFQSAGCEPFAYDGKGKSITLGYWTVPAEAMESPALMQPWARQAVAAALRARAAKASAPARKPRAARPKAPAAASRSRR
jgi:DNA transformation protein